MPGLKIGGLGLSEIIEPAQPVINEHIVTTEGDEPANFNKEEVFN